MKIVLITTIPSPYIISFCNEVDKTIGNSFLAIYCSNLSHMKWEYNEITHKHVFLNSKQITFLKNRYLINTSVWEELNNASPDIIVTCGFQIPMLVAIFYSLLKNRKLYIMSDSWELKEKKLSFLHRLIRGMVYKIASGFFPVSIKGKNNFLNYGINFSKIFIVPYVIDSYKYSKYNNISYAERPYDIMFSGQFISRKLPFFFAEVASKINQIRSSLKILIIGSGELELSFLEKLKEERLDYDYFGFIQPFDIPAYYAKAKILLFTTREDSWGVVANEAIATATPVITSHYAGAAGEIVINGENGYVLPLDSDVWAEKTIGLLNSPELYKKFQEQCIVINEKFKPSVAVGNFLKPFQKTNNDN